MAFTAILGGAARAEDLPPVPTAEAVTPRKLDLANQLIDASGAGNQVNNTLHAVTTKAPQPAQGAFGTLFKILPQIMHDAGD